MTTPSSGFNSGEIVVVSAADDGYAMPLAVTIRSALDRLAPERRMRLYMLDGGLSDETKRRLLRSWNDPRLTVEWVQPDLNQVGDLMINGHVNVVTYLRLLMPIVLPENVERVIYLDADMLVRRDLGELWDEPQGDHAVLAVTDVAAPRIDAPNHLPKFKKCRDYLAGYTPIMNFRELGLPVDAGYFNGGLLVANLGKWRRERYAEQMLDCLRTHREHVLWWDQYALNVVLAGKWRALDDRWNQGAHLFVYPSWRESPLERDEYLRLAKDPWIVHFCSPSKPWHYFCRHPYAGDFRKCLKSTDWADWRPEAPDRLLSAWWDFHYRPLRAEWKNHVRAIKRVVRGERRHAA